MRVYLDCYPCFIEQVLKTSRILGLKEPQIWPILSEVTLLLSRLPLDATPPEIGREVYRIISEKTGIRDPFRKIKQRCTQQALTLISELKKNLEKAEDKLMTAIRISIAGNVIDFGANTPFDLEQDIRTILEQDFAVNDYKEFRNALAKAQKILFLADNAGETVMDRILIEEIEKPLSYVVREKPVINDAVMTDAQEAGIENVAEIISSGTDAPGTILRLCSPEFLDIYKEADLIISKGQGNYEGLSGEKKPIFFLLKAKCSVIARDIGVKQGSIVLMKAKQS